MKKLVMVYLYMAPKKQTTQEALQQRISKLEAEISELKARNTEKTDELQQKISTLEARNTQKVASNKIKFFGLDDKGKKFAVECNISDSNSAESKCVVFGRPSIADSATKQQRHITPYSFLEAIVGKYTTNLSCLIVEKAREALLELKSSLKTLVSFTKSGLGFITDEFQEFEKFSKTWIKISTQLGSDNRDYYLVHKADSRLKKQLNEKKLSSAQSLYQDKIAKLLDYTISELGDEIISCDSLTLINQALIKLVLILFNTRPNISLPNDKWHTLDYSIRLYETSYGAQKNDNTGFETVTSDTLYERWRKNIKISERIRIVKDEGALVKATIESCGKISEIIQLLNEGLYHEAKKQMLAYNQLLQERKVLQEYTEQLTLSDFATNTTQDQKTVALDIMTRLYETNIPSHLYHVFDLKPLETQVLLPMSGGIQQSLGQNCFWVYTENTKKQYYFQNSKVYRGEEEPELLREDTEFVVQKVVDHVVIGILAFFNLTEADTKHFNFKLLTAFSQKIINLSEQYHFNKAQYTQAFEHYYKEYDIFNNVPLSDQDPGSDIFDVSVVNN